MGRCKKSYLIELARQLKETDRAELELAECIKNRDVDRCNDCIRYHECCPTLIEGRRAIAKRTGEVCYIPPRHKRGK